MLKVISEHSERFSRRRGYLGKFLESGESASDEITLKYQTNEFWGLQFSVGTINSRNLPIQNQWYDMYVIVARCNKMLKEVYNVPDMNEMDRRRYIDMFTLCVGTLIIIF